MASINKNFVVRNGLEVNNDLIYAEITNRRVGLGITTPIRRLHVKGGAYFDPGIEVVGVVTASGLLIGGTGTIQDLVVPYTGVINDLSVGNLNVAFNAEVAQDLTVGRRLFVDQYYGNGDTLSGIVTQIVAGAGISITATQQPGKGIVTIDAFSPVGKTVFVTQNGNDNNSGLSLDDAKKTIKAAASTALTRDTIKVYPGVYVEDNPIILNELVSMEGGELRNVVITPRFPERDMFYVNNGCHVTDMSFIGAPARDGAAMVALEQLRGTKEDRYFDAARMIRFNLDFISREAVGFLTSGYSGFAGDHLAQDAAKKIDANIDFIAAETIGFLTSTAYLNPHFIITNSVGVATDPTNCEDDIKDILRCLSNDLKAGSNKKIIGAGLSYYSDETLLHINSYDPNGNSVLDATVEAINYAIGIVTTIVRDRNWALQSGVTTYAAARGIYQDFSYSPLPGNCTGTISIIQDERDTLLTILQDGPNSAFNITGITTVYGVNLEVKEQCVEDVKNVWKQIVFDLTRGGNSKSVDAGKIYFDDNGTSTWDLKPLLKNPNEVEQTIATLEHSLEIAKSIVNNNCFGQFGAYFAGITTYPKLYVQDAWYDNHCGIVTVFIADQDGIPVPMQEAGLLPGDPVYFKDLVFGCGSGSGPNGFSTAVFPSKDAQTEYGGNYYGNLFCVWSVDPDIQDQFGSNTFQVLVGPSTVTHYYSNDTTNTPPSVISDWDSTQTIPHGYASGTVERKTNFQKEYTQVKDLAIQKDPTLGCEEFYPQGFNESVAGCKNVVSSLTSLVGVVTSILGYGATSGISTSYPGNRGEGIPASNLKYVSTASYDNIKGKVIVNVPGLNAVKGDRIELRDLTFSCNSGGPTSSQKFPSGTYGYSFYIDKKNGDQYTLNVGTSTLPHTYEGGGYVIDRTFDVSSAPYDHTTGIVTITASGAYVSRGDIVTIRDLLYNCGGPSAVTFPSEAVQTQYGGKFYGNNFKVVDIISDRIFDADDCQYSHTTGLTTITVSNPNFSVSVGDLVEIREFEFDCTSGAATTTIYPTGNSGGFVFKVYAVSGDDFEIYTGEGPFPHTYVQGGTVRNVTQRKSSTFTLDVGISTIPHTYVGPSGYIIPPYSPGVGPITQGPYIRNCTNFIANSIGMKVDGFDAEPGNEDDIGVTGTMSVDSYTQYNQGGIGVSITNGGYAQLVSIFTICDDIAIYTGAGGQCDLTNSNASFGNYGLYSSGVGDAKTKSIYHITGFVAEQALVEQDKVIIAGVGTYRPYDGQALYFGELFKSVKKLTVLNGGSGYSALVPPNVSVEEPPTDARGIKAEGSVNVDPVTGAITSIDVISEGSQYRSVPIVTIDPPPVGSGGVQATAQAEMAPIYYYIESATIPYNNGITGISTVVLSQNLNNTIERDTIVYFSRLSLQIATTISFEWVGAGTNINTAKPALGGVTIAQNEVVKLNGGQVVFTSTNQAGNFRIGTDLTINQLTGTISGRAFSQSLLQTVTPLIIALGR
jgi:hypothetical protein